MDAQGKADLLIEALPWIQQFAGHTVVIKFGGHAMGDPELERAFACDVAFLRAVGVRPVIVHGGGPQISGMLRRLNIPTEFRGGLRVTTPEAMPVIRMVLVGLVGRGLVGHLSRAGARAVGLSGEDAGLFTARRRNVMHEGAVVDVGLVGDVVNVDPSAIIDLLEAERVPVVASVAPDADGTVLNVNADTAAAALAVALDAAKLIMLTDVAGLYERWPDASTLLPQITVSAAEALLPSLDAGMVPKVEACVRAVRAGVPQATILDGRSAHSVLLEVFTPSGVGTMVVPDPARGSNRDSNQGVRHD